MVLIFNTDFRLELFYTLGVMLKFLGQMIQNFP